MPLPTMVFTTDDDAPTWIAHTQTINGRKWIAGSGPLPADIMLIGDYPGRDDLEMGMPFSGRAGQVLTQMQQANSLDLSGARFTNVLKFQPRGKNPSSTELKMSIPLLNEEIARTDPKLIVCLGKQAVSAVLGKGHALSDYHGGMVQHPTREGTQVYVTYNPSYVLHKPEAIADYEADWRMLGKILRGEDLAPEKTNYVVYTAAAEIRAFREWLFAAFARPILVIDCEWNGQHHMDPLGYLRTVQIGYQLGDVVVVELRDVQGLCIHSFDEEAAIFAELKLLFEDPRVRMVGHHIRADGKWLWSRGADIRPTTWYDTMVGEHTFNSTGPFNLTDMTLRYTGMGKYDAELVEWRNAHEEMCKHGYGPVPRDILLPYAAKDVDAPRRIMLEQATKLEPFTKPRGEYPSLLEIDMYTSTVLYELELTGMKVDLDRLSTMTKMYQTRRNELEAKLVCMASTLGHEDFNFRSPPQVCKLLFDTLDMTPIRTTNRIPWERVMQQAEEMQEDIMPTTDKETLAILADEPGAHPIIAMLRDIRKVEYVCKQWLVEPEIAENFDFTTRGGGMLAKIWPDGRLHANFSQLKETARFSSSRPNVQNWTKRAEGELGRILGKDLIQEYFGQDKLPTLRSIVVPTPGYVLMEADWKQAEMFILAGLSGDRTMWEALTTPGRDLHDLTAITAFDISVIGTDGNLVPDQYLLDMAARDPKWADDDSEFMQFIGQLIYVDPRGRNLTRKEFKSGIRVSAKNLNFGIPYGRGALDIAIQVKAETGTDAPIQQLETEIRQMMETWKTTTYPDAWRYMEDCAHTVVDPTYLTNPWGRQRRFPWPPVTERDMIAKLGREAQNFPIQSTVADTCLITLWLMDNYRREHGLGFRFVNQIHDAVLVEAPEDEVEETKQMFYETMGSIAVPMPNREPLRLGIDIDIMKRWGEK